MPLLGRRSDAGTDDWCAPTAAAAAAAPPAAEDDTVMRWPPGERLLLRRMTGSELDDELRDKGGVGSAAVVAVVVLD
jgi:hypothetical protein